MPGEITTWWEDRLEVESQVRRINSNFDIALKVAFIYPLPFGDFPDIYEYCTNLARMRMQVHYLGLKEGLPPDSHLEKGVTVEYPHLNGTMSSLRSVRLLRKRLEAIRPDVVHIFHFRGCSLLPLFAHVDGVKWILDVRTLYVGNEFGVVGRLAILKDRLKWAESIFFDHIVVLTEAIKRRLSPNLRQMTVIPLGASMDRLGAMSKSDTRRRTRSVLHISDNDLVLLYAGSVSPGRNVDRLLKAFSISAREEVKLRFLIVGGDSRHPEFLDSLKELSEREGVADRVHFVGRVAYTSIAQYYEAADIGISFMPPNTPHEHQPPTKLLEYLSAGLLAIANDVPASKEIITDNVNGLISGNSIEDIGATISRAAKLSSTSMQIRKAGMLAVQNRNWANIVATMIIPLYREVIEA